MISRERYDAICQQVDAAVKANNGHTFEIMLKTRCIYCRRSPKAKGTCRGWFMTFLNQLFFALEQEPTALSLDAVKAINQAAAHLDLGVQFTPEVKHELVRKLFAIAGNPMPDDASV